MKRFSNKLIVLLALALVFAFAAPMLAADNVTITVLGTSDMHGRIYAYDYATASYDDDTGFAKVWTLVKAERAQNPNLILIDNGDTTQDNLAELFNAEAVHPMIQALNFMKYDAWELGNHEFNFGLDFLNKNIAAFQGKVLAANIYKADGSRFVNPYVIVERGGVRVAIVGLITPHIPRWEASNPDHFAGLSFNDPLEEAKKVVKELEGKYDVLIGTFHMGDTVEYTETDGAAVIAQALPEFDVIFAGHKHSKFDNKEVNGVKIVEPGFAGAAVAKVDIALSKNGEAWKVETVTAKNLETKPAAEDKEILDLFAKVHEGSLGEANKVVGQISADFIARVDYITGANTVTTIPTSQIEDSSVIDLINEVQMFYAKAEISSAALFNFGSNLKQGPFKKKDVAFIYKYDNTLIGTHITGKNLKAYMEWSATYYNTYKSGDLIPSFNATIPGYNYDMFSGISYEIDITKPAGQRITNVVFQGQPIQDDKVYKLALNNYRFGTLLSLGFVKAEDKFFDSYETYQDAGRVRDLIIKYVIEQKGGVINPTVDNNWKIVGADYNHPYREDVFELVRKGLITVPMSENGRTPAVKSLNIYELMAEGKFSM